MAPDAHAQKKKKKINRGEKSDFLQENRRSSKKGKGKGKERPNLLGKGRWVEKIKVIASGEEKSLGGSTWKRQCHQSQNVNMREENNQSCEKKDREEMANEYMCADCRGTKKFLGKNPSLNSRKRKG